SSRSVQADRPRSGAGGAGRMQSGLQPGDGGGGGRPADHQLHRHRRQSDQELQPPLAVRHPHDPGAHLRDAVLLQPPRGHRPGAGAAAGGELRVERGRHRPDRDDPRGCHLDRCHRVHRRGRRLHLQQGPGHRSAQPRGHRSLGRSRRRPDGGITYAEPSFTEGPNALARTWIIPEHLFADVEDLATYANEEPVGTGPFVYDDFTAESYLLRTNDAYWDEGRPAIGGVRVSTTSGNQAATDMWLAGEVDYMSAAVPNLEEHVENNPDLTFTNTGISQMALMASSNPELGSEGPQTDPAVRKALYYGMDREQ